MKTKFFAALIAMIAIFICGPANAQKMTITSPQEYYPPANFSGEMKIEGEIKIGKINKVIVNIKVLRDVENIKYHFKAVAGARLIVGESDVFYNKLTKGQVLRLSYSISFDRAPAQILYIIRDNKGGPHSRSISYNWVDEDGKFWDHSQYLAQKASINYKNKIEYRYDPDEPLPLDQQNIQPGMITDEKAKATRAAIEEIRKTKGEISDYEAIELLHNRIELFIRTGIEGQEAIDILWQAREMTRQKGGDYWKNVEKIAKVRGTKFFRYGNFNNGLNSFGHGNDAC